MSVYFLQAKGRPDSPIKIGHSKNPSARLKQSQGYHWQELVLLATLPGGSEHERALHTHLADHRVRGEWFRPHPDVHSAARGELLHLYVEPPIIKVLPAAPIVRRAPMVDHPRQRRVTARLLSKCLHADKNGCRREPTYNDGWCGHCLLIRHKATGHYASFAEEAT